MEDSFHFAMLRISIAQILKASGFHKCKPSILNTVTDLYIQYFKLLLNKSQKYSGARTNSTNQIEVQDILQAMLDTELIKPSSFESILNPHDEHKTFETTRRLQDKNYNTKSIESFVDWIQFSDQFRLSQRLNQVPPKLLLSLIEKRKISDSNETDQERKRRKLKEKQEFYNQFKVSGEEVVGQVGGKLPVSYNHEFKSTADEEDDVITHKDKLSWLSYLAEKDLKLGNSYKFLNTVLQKDVLSAHKNKKFHPEVQDEGSDKHLYNQLANLNRHDYQVLNIEDFVQETEDEPTPLKPSEDLVNALPYNVKYSEAILDDSIDQYVEYYEQQMKHDKEDVSIDDNGIDGDNNLVFA